MSEQQVPAGLGQVGMQLRGVLAPCMPGRVRLPCAHLQCRQVQSGVAAVPAKGWGLSQVIGAWKWKSVENGGNLSRAGGHGHHRGSGLEVQGRAGQATRRPSQ